MGVFVPAVRLMIKSRNPLSLPNNKDTWGNLAWESLAPLAAGSRLRLACMCCRSRGKVESTRMSQSSRAVLGIHVLASSTQYMYGTLRKLSRALPTPAAQVSNLHRTAARYLDCWWDRHTSCKYLPDCSLSVPVKKEKWPPAWSPLPTYWYK